MHSYRLDPFGVAASGTLAYACQQDQMTLEALPRMLLPLLRVRGLSWRWGYPHFPQSN